MLHHMIDLNDNEAITDFITSSCKQDEITILVSFPISNVLHPFIKVMKTYCIHYTAKENDYQGESVFICTDILKKDYMFCKLSGVKLTTVVDLIEQINSNFHITNITTI